MPRPLSPSQQEAMGDMAATDQLPAALRRLLNELLVQASGVMVLGIYRREFVAARNHGNPDPDRYATQRTLSILTAFESRVAADGAMPETGVAIARYGDRAPQRPGQRARGRAARRALAFAPEVQEAS